ncbi:hypothetical protein ACFPFV_04640 [Salinicoccus siamensis]|uniref:DNA-binding transcriptional MerR regulator n=1 Tax=Salinicoccus siamensis TaxID=381830 RepID=A0ABV5Z495_9STAP
MKELNQAIFYTTAQVKDKVELSDQNVRKYVRLLEDRNYEVAKDEHNRRLFSQNDIAVLQEFIKTAKKPGYTLETAADEIISQVSDIVTEKENNMPASVTNNDINHMLGIVMEKLETMQQENRDLKNNVHRLVERLDEYGTQPQTLSLNYNDENNSYENQGTATSIEEHQDYEDIEVDENLEKKEEGSSDTYVAVDNDTQTPASDASPNIDMNQYSNHEVHGQSAESRSENEQREEKGGYLNKLFNIFKGK